jgi:hypothetical protein
MIDYPFVINDSEKWNDILERNKIPQLKWIKMMMEYRHYAPQFNPEILTYVDDVEFSQQCNLFFHFKKVSVKGIKMEFLKWFKQFWQDVYGKTFEEICYKCNFLLNQYNEDNKENKLPFINWIPCYGGLLQRNIKEAKDDELRYHAKYKMGFPFEPQMPPPGED